MNVIGAKYKDDGTEYSPVVTFSADLTDSSVTLHSDVLTDAKSAFEKIEDVLMRRALDLEMLNCGAMTMHAPV